MRLITKLTMTIIVVLIMTVGVLIPVTAGLEDNIKSVDQNSDYRFVLKNNNLNLNVECEEVGKYTINGRDFAGSSYGVIIGDGLYIYLFSSNYSIADVNNNIFYVKSDPGTIINIEKGEYTHANAGTTYTGTVETLLYPSANGDYGAFPAASTTLNADLEDPIYLISNKGSPEPKFALTVINGSENRNAALVAPITTNPLATYTGEVAVTFTSTLSEDGLSRNYSGFTATTDNSSFTPIVYAPIKYHVVDSTAETIREIVNILPIVILIGLLVAAGYAVVSSFGGRSEL